MNIDTNSLWFFASVVAALVGVVGTVIPVLPGIWLVWISLISAAWSGGFNEVGFFPLAFITVLAASSYLIDFVATKIGVETFGASKWAMAGAIIGSFVGVFFGFVGILVAPFIGAFIGEYYFNRDVHQASKAGLGAWLGFIIGTISKFAIACTMIGIFAVAYFL